MVDPHNSLINYYETIRKESVQYLKCRYKAELINDNEGSNNKYPVTVKILIQMADYNIDILFSLPFNYPDSFPKVRVESNSFKKIYPLPHLSKSGILCIFDDVLATPNPEAPLEVLDFTLSKTKEVLYEGLFGQNKSDYEEEFDSYWAEESVEEFLNIVRPSENIKEVYLLLFDNGNWKYKGIISDEKVDALNWVRNLTGKVDTNKFTKVLYIPLGNLPKYPFPKSNKDIYNLLKDQGLNIKLYTNFLTKSKRPTKILFSCTKLNSIAWGIWEHEKPIAIDVKAYKGKKKVRKHLRGYRTGIQNGFLEIVRDFPNVEIRKHIVNDIRNERLNYRGGDGEKSEKLKVVVIGCGAVGSHLIQNLVDINVEEFLIVDPDILSFENVKRHLCGINYVGNYKTKAVKRKLLTQFPNLKIDTSESNVLDLLIQYPNVLNNYDYVFVAISDFPTEQRLRKLQINNTINKPVFFMWVEPYMAGGHAILMNPNSNYNFLSLFDDSGEYKFHILKEGNQYSLRELGCNTSFVPYGVLELKKYILEVVTQFHDCLSNDQKNDYIYIWFGNLREQRKKHRLLSPKWVGASKYSSRIIILNDDERTGSDDIQI